MKKNYKYCVKLVSRYDRSRYLSGCLANKNHRLQLFSLYAFDIEISQIRHKVNDPLPGEVRLQWWRDALAGTQHGVVENHPIASALISTINTCKLPVEPFHNLLEARTFDVYNDPMPTMHDLEGYLGETSSIVFQLATLILTNNANHNLAEACGHAGVAYGLTDILRLLPIHCKRRQLYIPMDLIKKYHVSESDIFNFVDLEELAKILAEMRNHVRLHLKKFESNLLQIPLDAFPAFLPMCLVEPYLEKMEISQYQPYSSNVELSQYRLTKLIWSYAKSAKSMGLY